LRGASSGKGYKLSNTDEILVDRCQRGENKAFELLLQKYQRRIFHLIYRITQDPDVVEPLAQEVFMKAYKSISSFKGDSRFYTWLYRIAVNTCLSHNKRGFREESRGRQLEANIPEAFPKISSMQSEDPEKLYMKREFLRFLLNCVRRLPEELRTAIILREFTGLNYEEIADVMQVPIGTVRSRIFRARTRLREMMEPYADQNIM